MKDFFIGIRNTTASFFSWLVIVWMFFHTVFLRHNIALDTLWQLFILSLSWAVIFTFFYSTKIFTRNKFTPTKKFTLFMFVCTIVETLLIFAFGLFGITTIVQWGVFVGIVLILYAVSLIFFEIYKRQASIEFTKLLQNYQHDREC